MKRGNFKFLILIGFCYISATFAQDTTSIELQRYRGGFGIYPLPNKPMLGYRSNLGKRWFFDTKVAYVFQLSPQLNFEVNAIRRHVRNDVFNFYNGIGFMIDGFTPGFVIPIGFEIKPFSKYPNIIIVTEASPKLAFSVAGGVYSTLNGNVGVLFFRPAKKSKK